MSHRECRHFADEEREFVTETMQSLRSQLLADYVLVTEKTHRTLMETTISAVKEHGVGVSMDATISMDAKVILLAFSCLRATLLAEMASRLEDASDAETEATDDE